jgi:serine O-acetyltransferase
MSRIWGITIDEGTPIGGGFLIFHFGGIFIGAGVKVGNNVAISHDVTLGVGGTGQFRGSPVIGSNVYISPGSVVAGKIIVGNNVRIAPNCVVDRNIPDNCLVHPGPARLVMFSDFENKDSVPSWSSQGNNVANPPGGNGNGKL